MPQRRPRSAPHERPRCPQGHAGEHVNRATPWRAMGAGEEVWICFACGGKRFITQDYVSGEPAPEQRQATYSFCPRCESENIEQEPDGTWVCWRCDWFR